ncbi:hypothetical protein L3X38_011760 [Prunus dulcis]|uniref:DUF4371 domain-containing protein n=1 Tax=Prunus dulcis TaxID=3755 RepID=A0AAD4ZFF2_PRUDU|nr:hypothetical protein L3X38_011760 [Prunus dulcis]
MLENAQGNLKLVAPKIQKDIVNACPEETLDVIMSGLKDRLFSILVDEACDVSVKANGYGVALCGRQRACYDGASNMRGVLNGLKTKMLREQPCACYVHCFAHQLQLALVAIAKKNIDIPSFFTTTNSVVNYVGASCKRRDALRAQLQEELVIAFENDCLITGQVCTKK